MLYPGKRGGKGRWGWGSGRWCQTEPEFQLVKVEPIEVVATGVGAAGVEKQLSETQSVPRFLWSLSRT